MDLPTLDQVTVVVVTHHSAHCLAGLNALLAHCPHIIVSDNASNDGTPAQAQALWPQAQVLAHPHNLGFGAANNRALSRVTTPLAFLLNPAHHQRHAVVWEGVRREWFSMPYDDGGTQRFIWGATAGMLRNLYRFLSA